MQTNFTPEQLRDPELREANTILRSCVHCGMCTATCPTFVELGDELDSPRGRIYLIKDMLENGRPATELEARHVDRCLSCLSCMTTCPAGVNYMHLVDHARRHIEETYDRPLPERLLRRMAAGFDLWHRVCYNRGNEWVVLKRCLAAVAETPVNWAARPHTARPVHFGTVSQARLDGLLERLRKDEVAKSRRVVAERHIM